jgi:hypothetical protein
MPTKNTIEIVEITARSPCIFQRVLQDALGRTTWGFNFFTTEIKRFGIFPEIFHGSYARFVSGVMPEAGHVALRSGQALND